MKKIYILPIILLNLLMLSSCEEVVDVDLETAKPRLVIDASIRWQKSTDGREQSIKLSTTTGFYNSTIPTVSGAVVSVTNANNQTFSFIEEQAGSGLYLCHDFIPEINQNYQLMVVLNGQTYTATETLLEVNPITSIEQNNEGGLGSDEIEIKTFLNDPDGVDNYYMFRYKANINAVPTYNVDNDEFVQGNEFFGYYTNDKIKTGDVLDITLYGISKRYFEYMSKIILIAQGSDGPFSTPPATVRGNIVNQTNTNNFALGYFSLSETDRLSYTIQ
ncbi:DUF4249 domain-containing protein [Flavobacterium sp. CYK-55]|uniref:DUF4249 domain-containing protein n=1 Tax=Flavobacterium sp. CYK-55 TaxID=2835529 RepID=UPI001BCEA228|nr:DUF4249 domain-containing protein [Flavobacterium sp. CYK-55]MBS7788249.1 DUF4249 domain-containing protein [Flavobacterium sp. CYK-55]